VSECWASELGDCSAKMSREHLVSRSVFIAPKVRVQGLPWCKDQPKDIGLDSAVSKFLCSKHNSLLSPLDTEAGRFGESIRGHLALAAERSQLPSQRFKVVRFDVRAKLLERWLLKTLINLCLSGTSQLELSTANPNRPRRELVEVAFGKLRFKGKSGMYVAAHAGMRLDMNESVSFSPLLKDEVRVCGGFFTFYGIHLFLCLDQEGLDIPLSSIPRMGSTWVNAELKWRFRKMKGMIGNNLSHEIRFVWH
jgi:hypothetical protein